MHCVNLILPGELLEPSGNAPSAARHEHDAVPPRPRVPQLLAVEAGDRPAIADHDVALGNPDDLGVEPVHAAAVDPDGPDLHRDVGQVKPQAGAVALAYGGSLPKLDIDADPALTCALQANPLADTLESARQAVGLLP
jgi:hypothetical protein